jgi:UDP-glucose 4-epimerase
LITNKHKFIITGCAGFVGSNFTDLLLSYGHIVIGIDNFSTGKKKYLDNALKNKNFQFHEVDLLDKKTLNKVIREADFVVHFAANADVRFGLDHPHKDLEQNTIATFNLLEAMRLNGLSNIIFSSTGSIYGDAKVIPTPENCEFPIQTSLYGASKLACESLIQAYIEGYKFTGWIFRFVSVLGPRYSHGHVLDFVKQLKKNPLKLHILGDGNQLKSYIHIEDCLSGIIAVIDNELSKNQIFNIGTDSVCSVTQSALWISEQLGLKPEITYAGGSHGWIGDNKHIHLNTEKIKTFNWKYEKSIEYSVKDTVRYLLNNSWILDYE